MHTPTCPHAHVLMHEGCTLSYTFALAHPHLYRHTVTGAHALTLVPCIQFRYLSRSHVTRIAPCHVQSSVDSTSQNMVYLTLHQWPLLFENFSWSVASEEWLEWHTYFELDTIIVDVTTGLGNGRGEDWVVLNPDVVSCHWIFLAFYQELFFFVKIIPFAGEWKTFYLALTAIDDVVMTRVHVINDVFQSWKAYHLKHFTFLKGLFEASRLCILLNKVKHYQSCYSADSSAIINQEYFKELYVLHWGNK